MSVPEVLLIDVSRFDAKKIGEFKYELWKNFGIESSKYENNWDFEQYMRLFGIMCMKAGPGAGQDLASMFAATKSDPAGPAPVGRE